ncbi:hypothetical protein ACJX0J_017587, partial [Zea mays]
KKYILQQSAGVKLKYRGYTIKGLCEQAQNYWRLHKNTKMKGRDDWLVNLWDIFMYLTRCLRRAHHIGISSSVDHVQVVVDKIYGLSKKIYGGAESSMKDTEEEDMGMETEVTTSTAAQLKFNILEPILKENIQFAYQLT